ncbi:MAG: dihydrodipicolinate synthase family protein [Nanoarchaeota archaeon]|nr:dihydrodipicolinate synthase family protein [Nanoarchaeota archaeon]MBU1946883.1 dihydrodipicolinate synthase family protein [Nanoarchaeota archaeon]
MPSTKPISGNIVPYVTLFNHSGNVDYKAMYALFQATAPFVDAAFVGGGTGQGWMLDPQDLGDIVKLAKGVFNPKPVIAAIWEVPLSCSQPIVRKGEDYAGVLKARGVDSLVIPPPITETPLGANDILQYYSRIDNLFGDIRKIVYNNPGLTHNPLTLPLSLDIASAVELGGYKDSSGDLGFLDSLLQLSEGWFDVYLGSEALAAQLFPDSNYQGKFKGVVGSTGNAAAEFMGELWNAYAQGNLERSRRLGDTLLEALPLINGPSNSEIVQRLTFALNSAGIGSPDTLYNPASDAAKGEVISGLKMLQDALKG